MMLFLKFLLLSAFILFPSNDPEKMVWSETDTLSWNDFQAKPDNASDFIASTNSGITFSYSFSGKNGERKLEWTVQSHFYPELSWYKKGRVSEYILAHEQTHFDITELHARMLRKKLEAVKFSKELKNEIESLYRQTETDRREMQRKFDFETEHSVNTESESRWRISIAQQLKAHSRWE